ncbi:MAG TPA: bifunctional 5,10-methylenetetrahydrofolate dehydrogenase/5,10-methenyltetrahydrofolate cyclohydrolase [Candidatus Bipolaricaulota bacterium]
MHNLLDGKVIASQYRRQLKAQVAELSKRGVTPSVVIYYIGEDASADLYFNAKRKLAADLGILAYARRFERIEEELLIRQIENCNENCEIDGICIELPLPPALDAQRVRRAVTPDKDVDGINPTSLGRLIVGQTALPPATPMAVIELMRAKDIRFEGKDAVIVGRSEVVGTPLALLLMRENATVTVCHSKTQNLVAKTLGAEILCVAVGKPGFIRADMVREGAIVIDIGVNVTPQGLVGDVAFDEVQPKAQWITPVPGGVGPMTSTLVMQNVIQSARRRL